MENKVLVAYASKYGSTAEIAEKVGEVLRQKGLEADVVAANKVKNVGEYKAVVLGSAAYIGSWRKEAVSFVKKYENTLAQKPVWIFSSGPTDEGDPLELVNGWMYPKKIQENIARIKPRETKVLHGKLDENKISGLQKWMLSNAKVPFGDFRDWESITAWAEKIADEVNQSA